MKYLSTISDLSEYNKAVVLVIFAGIFLSTLGLGTRLMESTSGLQLVFYRSIGLLLAMIIIIWHKQRSHFFTSFRDIGYAGWLCSICLVGTSIFVVMAITNTSVANAMFIISLTPLIAGVFAWLLLGERMHRSTVIAIGIALLGVLTIIQGALSSDGITGIMYAFGMLLCYGLFSVGLRTGKDVDMLPCIAIHAVVLITGLGLVLEDLSISDYDLMICLALGVFQLGAGLTLMTLGSKHVPAAQLTLLAMLEIVLAPIWVWIGVGETPSLATCIGGVIIIAAISYQALSVKQPPS